MLRAFLWLGAFVVLIWAIFAVNLATNLFGFDFRDFGVKPRSVAGLWGIPLHAFLHAGFFHVFANTVPLLILGGLTAFRGESNFLGIMAFTILAGGALLWLIGRPNSNHIGASGLVFGFFGYLVARGFYTRSVLSIIVAAAVIAFYGWSMLLGVLPTAGFVSWEGHLSGLIAGGLYAFLESRGRRDDE